ncbi:MAG: hypothetical protein LBS16_07025 [Prevotellaceae bacterium]|jgi:electron transport complex protein RnfA|nr:hypothetical protein [Prevotellaceae bacterium]
MTYFALIFTAVFINNMALTQFFGVGILLFAPDNQKQSLWLSAALVVITTLSAAVCYLLDILLRVWDVHFLTLLIDVTVIAIIVEAAVFVLRRIAKSCFSKKQPLAGWFVSNATILAAVNLATQSDYTFSGALASAASAAAGVLLVMALFTAIRQQLLLADVPPSFRGAPIELVTLGILAMAFAGFLGIS